MDSNSSTVHIAGRGGCNDPFIRLPYHRDSHHGIAICGCFICVGAVDGHETASRPSVRHWAPKDFPPPPGIRQHRKSPQAPRSQGTRCAGGGASMALCRPLVAAETPPRVLPTVPTLPTTPAKRRYLQQDNARRTQIRVRHFSRRRQSVIVHHEPWGGNGPRILISCPTILPLLCKSMHRKIVRK